MNRLYPRTFGLPVVVDLLENLHRVRTPAAHFRVPEEEPLGFYVPVDETADRRAERLLLVASDPDQVPARALQACRERSTEPGTGTNTNAARIQFRCVRNTGELELTRPDVGRRVVDEAAGEVALHTADEVVVLGVCSL